LIRQVSTQYFRLFSCHTPFVSLLPTAASAAPPLGLRTPHSDEVYSFDSPRLASLLRVCACGVYGSVLTIGMMGLCFVRIRGRAWEQCLALLVIYHLALFLFLLAKPRFAIQLLPVFVFFSAAALHVYPRALRGSDAGLPGFVVTRIRIAASLLAGTTMLHVITRPCCWGISGAGTSPRSRKGDFSRSVWMNWRWRGQTDRGRATSSFEQSQAVEQETRRRSSLRPSARGQQGDLVVALEGVPVGERDDLLLQSI